MRLLGSSPAATAEVLAGPRDLTVRSGKGLVRGERVLGTSSGRQSESASIRVSMGPNGEPTDVWFKGTPAGTTTPDPCGDGVAIGPGSNVGTRPPTWIPSPLDVTPPPPPCFGGVLGGGKGGGREGIGESACKGPVGITPEAIAVSGPLAGEGIGLTFGANPTTEPSGISRDGALGPASAGGGKG